MKPNTIFIYKNGEIVLDHRMNEIYSSPNLEIKRTEYQDDGVVDSVFVLTLLFRTELGLICIYNQK